MVQFSSVLQKLLKVAVVFDYYYHIHCGLWKLESNILGPEQVRSEFYRDMQGILLTYDVTDRSSFIALDAWLAELRHNLGP